MDKPKPKPYPERRLWQLEAIARGEAPICGREACNNVAAPAWIGSGTGTELRYCKRCALHINRRNGMEICRPEVSDG